MSKYKLNVLLFPALLLLSPGLVNAQVARHYDVVIDELLPDPSPPVGLPNSEFIELKNRAGFPINLRNWKVRSGSGTATIIVNYLLQPDSFVVICAASVAGSFSAFGPVIGVSSFPSLNNDEDVISLISPESTVIHAVGYEFNWFDNALKSEGGWTLEMIDTGNPCGPGNWKSSVNSKGGTV